MLELEALQELAGEQGPDPDPARAPPLLLPTSSLAIPLQQLQVLGWGADAGQAPVRPSRLQQEEPAAAEVLAYLRGALADAQGDLQCDPPTVLRWARGKTTPRPHHIPTPHCQATPQRCRGAWGACTDTLPSPAAVHATAAVLGGLHAAPRPLACAPQAGPLHPRV